MTSQEKVKSVYPQARAECYRYNGRQRDGYTGFALIWSAHNGIRLASGMTASEAWKRAAERPEVVAVIESARNGSRNE